MSESIKIDIKRTGFPVDIGKVELWFDSSMENLRTFFDVEKIAKEKLQEIADKGEHIHFPKDINEKTVEDIDPETIDEAFNLNKEYLAIQYDLVFGKGTFKKVYEVYPDFLALENILDTVGAEISQKVEEDYEERTKAFDSRREEVLKKKKQKQKKK